MIPLSRPRVIRNLYRRGLKRSYTCGSQTHEERWAFLCFSDAISNNNYAELRKLDLMKKYLGVGVLFFAFCLLSPATMAQPNETRVINYARRIKASTLDSSLPRTTIETWFRSVVGPKAKISWETNDCGEQTGAPGAAKIDVPMCAQVRATLEGNREVGVSIGVGTFRKGIFGKPTVFYAYINDSGSVRHVSALRQLSTLLKSPSESR